VLRRATRILERLEADPNAASRPQLDLFAPRSATGPTQAPQPSSVGADVLGALRAMDPDDLSPREAHALLVDLADRLRTGACSSD
jgi:DNA mismatch repair protein MutS